jgi:hypothetical protein
MVDRQAGEFGGIGRLMLALRVSKLARGSGPSREGRDHFLLGTVKGINDLLAPLIEPGLG